MKTRYYIQLCAVLSAASAGAHAQATFTQITNSPVVSDIGNFQCAVWGDFHHSGFQDLIVTVYGQTNVYYRNNGDGTFTKISQGEPVRDRDYHVCGGAGDYDNDGNLDLFVTAGAYASAARNRLYHGNGDGTFSLVSGGVVTNQLGYFGPGSWADYDNDGFLDLYISNHGSASDSGGKNLLFHNNGDGTFSQVTTGAIANDTGAAFCGVWQDYDDDGFPDLLVVNAGTSVNFLYHNNRDGTFTRITTGVVATDNWGQGAACAAWGDYDNDGFPDLYVTDQQGKRNRLYHNNGDGTFTAVTSGPELAASTGGSFNGCVWGDYDNDGYLDLFVSGKGEHNALFHNNGDGTFTQITSGAPVEGGGPGIYCQGVSWADYDNDGFLDLFVAEGESAFKKNLLYHNDGNSNAWLEVKLVGTVANRSAIGAKVRVHATVGGKTFWQLREITGGSLFNGVPLVAHFGLGDATNADTLRIEWPSGTVQEFQNVAARQILTVTEPSRLFASNTGGALQLSVKGGRFMPYDIQQSADLMTWSPLGTVTITNLDGSAEISGPAPPTAAAWFYRAVSH
jgi:ASPIC and UnbV/FG-GAP-like repeat